MKVAIIVALALVGFGCESAIVGGKCEKGFVLCGGECVNLQRDFRNCGRCGSVCREFVCTKGQCEDSARDAAVSGDAQVDAAAEE